MVKKISLVISIVIFVINIFNYNFEFEISDSNNKISLVGILASSCAIVLF